MPDTPPEKMSAHELVAFLCEGSTHETAAVMMRWITASKRFHAFSVDHRTKIRKKLRIAGTPQNVRSALLELEVARHFIEDRRCLVEYERYGQGRVRSPDLTVTFRTQTAFNLEVTQVQEPGAETPEWEWKLIGLVCGKLGQMMPQSFNVLVVAPESGSLTVAEITGAMKRLKARIEQRESDLLSRFGFAEPAGFFKQFQWLSGILVWKREGDAGGNGKSLWANPQVRRPLPAPIVSLLTREEPLRNGIEP